MLCVSAHPCMPVVATKQAHSFINSLIPMHSVPSLLHVLFVNGYLSPPIEPIHGLLVLYLAVHGKEPLPALDASEVQEVRKELVAIRDKVNILLNAIDGHPKQTVESVSQQGRRVTTATLNSIGSQETVVKSDPSLNKGATEASHTCVWSSMCMCGSGMCTCVVLVCVYSHSLLM